MELEISGGRRPGLRFEAGSGYRMLLRQRESVVLRARVHHRYHGVDVHRTGAYESPVPPVSASLSRRLAGRWDHQFGRWLSAADNGPLHDGSWLLESRALPPYCLTSDLVTDFPDAYLDWFGEGWNGVLPLRPLPGDGTARVKACRKRARDGTLAPILLWRVTGLDGYVLLDGHSRLVAALTEQIRPSLLVLDRANDRRTRAWPLRDPLPAA